MKRAKILMIGPSIKQEVRGGISSVVYTLLNSQLIYKYRIKYIATTPVVGNKVKKFIFFIKSMFVFIGILSIGKTKVIHIHTASRESFYRKSFFAIISKIFNRKVILHIHGAEFHVFYSEHGKLQSRYIKKILDSVNEIIVLSNQWYEIIEKMTLNRNISIVHNPVDCASFNINKRNKNSNKDKIVLFMGEIGKRKGIYVLVSAVLLIYKYYKNIKFVLAGDGEIVKVKNICKEKNIQDNVYFPGFIQGEEKIKSFHNADIYVLPSYNEGLPVSVLEAMAAGLPIVTTPVGGIPEAVEDGVNGFLVEPGNFEMLADRILRLLDDEELRKKMGGESLRIAKERFDINVIAEKLSEIYEGLLKA